VACHGVDAALMGWWRLLHDADKIPESGRHVAVVFDQDDTPEVIIAQDGIPILMRTIAVPDGDEEEQAIGLAREIGFSMLSLELEHGVCSERSATVWGRGDIPETVTANLHEQCECPVETDDLDALPARTEGIARRSLDNNIIDLTPPEWREQESAQRFKKQVLLWSGIFVGIWLILLVGLLGGVYYQERLLRNLESERDEWAEPAQEVSDIRRRVGVIREYANQEQSSLEVFRELAINMPEGVLLTSFTYRKGEAVKIVGEADTTDQVYDFKGKLDQSTLFEEVRLNGPQSIRRSRSAKKWGFDMDLRLPRTEEEEE